MRMAVSKKTARIIAAGLFALTLLFALAPTALAAVYWGQSGETVRRVQQKLKQWGYYIIIHYVKNIILKKDILAI